MQNSFVFAVKWEKDWPECVAMAFGMWKVARKCFCAGKSNSHALIWQWAQIMAIKVMRRKHVDNAKY